jgi:hypothetical protein
VGSVKGGSLDYKVISCYVYHRWNQVGQPPAGNQSLLMDPVLMNGCCQRIEDLLRSGVLDPDVSGMEV